MFAKAGNQSPTNTVGVSIRTGWIMGIKQNHDASELLKRNQRTETLACVHFIIKENLISELGMFQWTAPTDINFNSQLLSPWLGKFTSFQQVKIHQGQKLSFTEL